MMMRTMTRAVFVGQRGTMDDPRSHRRQPLFAGARKLLVPMQQAAVVGEWNHRREIGSITPVTSRPLQSGAWTKPRLNPVTIAHTHL